MLTLAKLLQMTPNDIVKRGLNECISTVKDVSLQKDEKGEHKLCTGTVKGESGERAVKIKFYTPEKSNLADSEVWVHCSCPYYQYTVEVVNAKEKSSSVFLSNGKRPEIKNPQMKPHLCKHLVSFAKKAMSIPPKKA